MYSYDLAGTATLANAHMLANIHGYNYAEMSRSISQAQSAKVTSTSIGEGHIFPNSDKPPLVQARVSDTGA